MYNCLYLYFIRHRACQKFNIMKDIKEVIYGKDFSDKHNRFMEALNTIEDKYKDFFENRPPRNEFHEHDRLHNHYGITIQYGVIRFGIDKDSELPENIQRECHQAFDLIWNESVDEAIK